MAVAVKLEGAGRLCFFTGKRYQDCWGYEIVGESETWKRKTVDTHHVSGDLSFPTGKM